MAGNEHRGVFFPGLRSVVDIGANRGQFALAARTFVPQARIHSFEPLSGPAAVFRKVFAKDPLTELHPCAIGAREGRVAMHVSARDDSSSLLAMTDAHSHHYPGTGTVNTEDVQVMPLSRLITPHMLPPPVLLKIDVQGAEYDTLAGCEDLLPKVSYIYCECSFIELFRGQKLAAEIVTWLWARGFALAGVHNIDTDAHGTPLQADFLFQRDDRIS